MPDETPPTPPSPSMAVHVGVDHAFVTLPGHRGVLTTYCKDCSCLKDSPEALEVCPNDIESSDLLWPVSG